MNIVKSNFKEKLSFVLESIETSDFIAFDTEFSGLHTDTANKTVSFDEAEERYQKLKHTVEVMNAFQIGIVTFKFDGEKYVARPFNFYCFPSSDLLEEKTMSFKPKTVEFLRKNHFDFNKMFSEGVNYQR